MRLEWTRLALLDLTEAQDHVAQENPLAAQILAQRIIDATKRLAEHPAIGRPGQVSGTRELVVDRTPYLIVYRVEREAVELLRIWHGRRNWQTPPSVS